MSRSLTTLLLFTGSGPAQPGPPTSAGLPLALGHHTFTIASRRRRSRLAPAQDGVRHHKLPPRPRSLAAASWTPFPARPTRQDAVPGVDAAAQRFRITGAPLGDCELEPLSS